MKKAKRSLLFSLLSLVFVLAITATSTYAWFVVNRTVTATNMQVTVKSDTTWLVIGANSTKPASVAAIGEGQTVGTGTSAAAATAANAQVLPIMYDQADNGNGIKWKYNTGTSYTNGQAASQTYTALTDAQVTSGEYFVKYTFYVGLTATSAATQYHLRVNSITVSADAEGADKATFLPAVSAMVECEDQGGAKVDYENISGITAWNTQADLLASVSVDTVYTINVYVYINGDNAAVKSENATAAKLGGFTLTATFGVSNAN